MRLNSDKAQQGRSGPHSRATTYTVAPLYLGVVIQSDYLFRLSALLHRCIRLARLR